MIQHCIRILLISNPFYMLILEHFEICFSFSSLHDALVYFIDKLKNYFFFTVEISTCYFFSVQIKNHCVLCIVLKLLTLWKGLYWCQVCVGSTSSSWKICWSELVSSNIVLMYQQVFSYVNIHSQNYKIRYYVMRLWGILAFSRLKW